MEHCKIKKKDQPVSPLLEAGYLSQLFTCWVFPFLRLGNKRELEHEDIYKVLNKDSTRYLGSQFEKFWNKELDCTKPKTPSLVRALLRTFGSRFLCIALQFIIIDALRLTQSIVLGLLIQCLDGEYPIYVAYALGATLILFNYIYITIRQNRTVDCQVLGMNVRVTVSNMLYTKSLKLSQESLATSNVGQATNFLSNDVNRYDRAMIYLPSLFSCPVQLVLGIAILWYYVGVASLAGFGLLVIFIPFQSYIGKVFGKMRANVAEKSDIRLKYMYELISGILLVKISTWEKYYLEVVGKARSAEMKTIRIKSILQALNLSIFDASSKTVVLVTLVACTWGRNIITAQMVFVTLSLYSSIWALVTRWVPTAISSLSEVLVSTRRIEKFLLLDEKNEKSSPGGEYTGLVLQNISAKWLSRSDDILSNIDLKAGPRRLIGITGPVGSGKSSLLQAILGELPLTNGSISVQGRLAYTPQDPWLFSGTIQENIILGYPFDHKWFKTVVEACALSRDFDSFPFGDKTLVGDKGITLSGGQKARINLARAAYANADIYLLDDPLSSVDSIVGRQLMDNCIIGLLKDKCVLLVTHQIRYLESAHEILLLRHGQSPLRSHFEKIVKLGNSDSEEIGTTVDALLDSDGDQLNVSWLRTQNAVKNEIAGNEYGTFKSSKATEQGEKEARSSGVPGWNVWVKYLLAGNSFFTICIFWILSIFTQFLLTGSDYWLKIWTNNISSSDSDKAATTNNKFELIYAAIILGVFIVGLVKTQLMFRMFLSSSIKLQNHAFESILRAPMRFFEVNAIGRIMNRFSNDLGNMDEAVPTTAYFVILEICLTLGQVGIVAVNLQSGLVILPVGFAIGMCFIIYRFYMKSAASVKRLEGISRSPVFGQLSTALQGLSVIRAFDSEEYFKTKFLDAQDRHTSAYYMSLCIGRWCAMCLSFVGNFFVAVVVLALIYTSADSATAGLVISSIITLNLNITYGVIQFTDLANELVSVERVIEYTNVKSEPGLEIQGRRPVKSWPQRGILQMNDIFVKHGNAPFVLKGINFHINSCEKTGFVGRTGAGKSSLIAAIFRLVEPHSGAIHLDGVNLLQLCLRDFRSKISFIPQNPILFTGTIRENLDPLHRFRDDELWKSLESVQLSHRFSNVHAAGLDEQVVESGVNFSQGEKQLLCLARSLLSNNKVLILDEATANVDPMTDALIQKAIRAAFQRCTVLIVAHCLETVMDCDRICVLEAGRIMEFDSPLALLNKGEGLLHDLVQKTGPSGSQRLRAIAEKVGANSS